MKRAHRYSETRSRSTISAECTNTQNNVIKPTSGKFWLYSLNMTILGDSDDICDPKGHLMCPMNFRPPPWILLLNALTYDARAPTSALELTCTHACTHTHAHLYARTCTPLSLSHTHIHTYTYTRTRWHGRNVTGIASACTNPNQHFFLFCFRQDYSRFSVQTDIFEVLVL